MSASAEAAARLNDMIEGSIFSIRLGLPGSGKSLGLTEEDLLPHLLAGEEVWTNYWVNWKLPNLHFFTADDFEELAPTLRNCVLVMDEIGQVMEPRAWEQESGNIRRFFQLHRHHHVDIYGTTQDISLVAKSAWIVVDEWILCHKIERNWWDMIVDLIFRDQSFRVGYQDMTYQELKKMAYGWENQIDEDEENQGRGVGGDIRIVRYYKSKLIHPELDDKKVELEHLRCEKCAGRQKDVNNSGFCPKHGSDFPLIEVKSGIYDSDYDLPIKEKELTFVAMIDSPKGYRKIPYKGALSDRQLEQKNKLSTGR